jgi:hypothetical protein
MLVLSEGVLGKFVFRFIGAGRGLLPVFEVESSRFVIISHSDSMVEMDLLPWLP